MNYKYEIQIIVSTIPFNKVVEVLSVLQNSFCKTAAKREIEKARSLPPPDDPELGVITFSLTEEGYLSMEERDFAIKTYQTIRKAYLGSTVFLIAAKLDVNLMTCYHFAPEANMKIYKFMEEKNEDTV